MKCVWGSSLIDYDGEIFIHVFEQGGCCPSGAVDTAMGAVGLIDVAAEAVSPAGVM